MKELEKRELLRGCAEVPANGLDRLLVPGLEEAAHRKGFLVAAVAEARGAQVRCPPSSGVSVMTVHGFLQASLNGNVAGVFWMRIAIILGGS